MLSSPQDFLRWLVSPYTVPPRNEQPPHLLPDAVLKELSSPWRAAIEAQALELGYGLRAFPLRGVLRPRQMVGQALFHNGELYVNGSAVHEGKFSKTFLHYHLPLSLIYRPLCRRSVEEKDAFAAEGAANSLLLQDLSASSLRQLMTDPTSEVVESEETILEEIALTLQSLSTEELLRRIVAYFSGDEVSTERALAILHAAQASRRYTLPEDPAFAVTPYLLAGIGIPQKAVGWLADKHGWIEGEDGWGNVFLPLQTKALLEGICDPKRLLFQSGVIAASTSAGKTLLAELRFLTRHFLTEPDTPKKTVMLVPTREIGMERVAALREA